MNITEGIADDKAVGLNFKDLLSACRQFKKVFWIAEVGCEKDGLVPHHFNGVQHVFAFSNGNNHQPSSDQYSFGHLAYDLKNELERLTSANSTRFQIINQSFFNPEFLIVVMETGEIRFEHGDEAQFLSLLDPTPKVALNWSDINLKPALSKTEYVDKVHRIKSHIQQGDVYELNFCMDHFADDIDIDPVQAFSVLSQRSEAPFCAFYKLDSLHIICQSPERFMAKRGDRLYAQPMKGTAKRIDDLGAEKLAQDPKERSENIMITDLVRNDLSRSAKKGSVKVDELCGVYPFGSVWQMISTVSCEQNEAVDSESAIHNAFPMGSMTGAPKVRAMELIEELEDFRRGIYSGSIGYFAPNGDFDFNVVIRSLIYDSRTKRLSCPTGSAITIKSDPEKEYEECMLKAEWIKNSLNSL